MERLYKRNVLSQQVWYKLRLLAHVRNIIRQYERGGVYLGIILVVMYLLDSLIGMVVVDSTLLYWRVRDCSEYTAVYTLSMLKWMRLLLEWLMNVPAGLKLNDPLTEFLSDKFIYLLRLWEFFYSALIVQHLHRILYYILYVRFMGLTIVLSVLFDFLKFLNLWLICFYLFSNRIIRMHLSALRSLFRLFMGRKWNPLRERVDSCVYDPNQLLLGTLFFISLLFLLPTTAMFHGVFLSLRVVQYFIQSMIRLCIVLINRAIVLMMEWVCTKYIKPSISTLSFKVSEGSSSSVHGTKALSVVGVWNSKEYDLHVISELVESVQQQEEDSSIICFDCVKQLSMNKWFDINPF